MNLYPDTCRTVTSRYHTLSRHYVEWPPVQKTDTFIPYGDATERCVWLNDVSGTRDQSSGEVSTRQTHRVVRKDYYRLTPGKIQ